MIKEKGWRERRREKGKYRREGENMMKGEYVSKKNKDGSEEREKRKQ